ncbi:MAG: hypothetical protein AB3A66_21145 [Nodularia sp. CChRGM 3473]
MKYKPPCILESVGAMVVAKGVIAPAQTCQFAWAKLEECDRTSADLSVRHLYYLGGWDV